MRFRGCWINSTEHITHITMTFKSIEEFNKLSKREKTMWLKEEIILAVLNDEHINEIIDYFYIFVMTTPYSIIRMDMKLNEWEIVDRIVSAKNIKKWNYIKNTLGTKYDPKIIPKNNYGSVPQFVNKLVDTCIDDEMYQTFKKRGLVEESKCIVTKNNIYIPSPLSGTNCHFYYIKRTANTNHLRKAVLKLNHIRKIMSDA